MFSKDRDIPVRTYLGTNDPLISHNFKTFSSNDIIDIIFLYVCNETGLKDVISQSIIDFLIDFIIDRAILALIAFK